MSNIVRGLRRLGKRIAEAQARALLFVFYFVALGPFALVVRWFSDPLAIKPRGQHGWRDAAEPGEHTLARARKQF